MAVERAYTAKKEKINLLDNPRYRMLTALFLAVVGWVIVTVGIQPNTSTEIYNVPVNFEYDAERYTALGLSIVNNPSHTVSLKVYGNGSDIGSLYKDDFVVYPRYTSQLTSGSAELPLNVELVATHVDPSDIKVSIEPQNTTVKVVFDTVEEKAVPVRIVSRNLAVADGYTLHRTTSVPAEVILTGPAGELQSVKEAVAVISSASALDHTVTISAPLSFVDAAGEEVEFTYVKPNIDTADVTLTVYKLAELPLRVSLINTPVDFDAGVLKYTLSQDTLQVAGPATIIDGLTDLRIGTIDLSTFALDKIYEMPVELPNGLVSLENVNNVTVSFDTDALTTKKLNISAQAVQVVNLPSSYTLEVRTERIKNVVLCGPADVLEGLTADSVVALIDADDLNIVTGQQNIAVTIYVPANNQVFALGNYSVSCQIESQ